MECKDYPCRWIHTLAKAEPTPLYDGHRIKENGLEARIEEQGERRQSGSATA
jgi:hypothetical protein